MKGKCDTDCFIEKAKKVHGDKYDYSLVEYINNQTKITIICREHGEFEQRPNDHTSHKNGCRKCGAIKQKNKIKLDTETIREKFIKIYGDKYDYSLFEYKGTYYKSIVICPKHGEFLINATSHISGLECKICKSLNKVTIRDGNKIVNITEEVFLEKVKEKYKDRFDYSNINFINTTTPITFRCKEHNLEITQTPRNHLYSKGGCIECKKQTIRERTLKTTEDFIIKLNEVHNHFYNYSKSIYTNSKHKIKIICPIHGEFEQFAGDHKSGRGCRKCGNTGTTYNRTKANRHKNEWSLKETVLYLIHLSTEEGEEYIKIGISNNFNKRYSVIERRSKSYIIEHFEFYTNLYDATIIEQDLIKELKLKKYIPKIKFAGYTECFNVEVKNEILKNIKNSLHN